MSDLKPQDIECLIRVNTAHDSEQKERAMLRGLLLMGQQYGHFRVERAARHLADLYQNPSHKAHYKAKRLEHEAELGGSRVPPYERCGGLDQGGGRCTLPPHHQQACES